MAASERRRIRVGIRVSGLVQGVGFRPHVYGLAVALGVAGWVGNDSGGVFIEAEGDADAVAEFRELLVAVLEAAPETPGIEIEGVAEQPGLLQIGSAPAYLERPTVPARVG